MTQPSTPALDQSPNLDGPLRVVGWNDERLSTNRDRPDQILIDWVLSRRLTEFEVRIVEDMSEGHPDTIVHDSTRGRVRATGSVKGLVSQIVELDRRLQVIESAGSRREQQHEDLIADAREALHGMNWEQPNTL